jgi:hypothetical protein
MLLGPKDLEGPRFNHLIPYCKSWMCNFSCLLALLLSLSLLPLRPSERKTHTHTHPQQCRVHWAPHFEECSTRCLSTVKCDFMFFFFCKHFSLEFQQLNEFQIASHIFLSFFGSKLHILRRTSFSKITLFRWCKIAL